MREINDKAQWNELLLKQPTQSGIFLQSWEWGEFQQAVGRCVYRYRADDSFAQVIELPLPFGKKYWFIPRGTIIDGLEEEARKHGALFVRFEPMQGSAPRGSVKTKPVSPTQTLLIDLLKSEDELLAGMHEKTRYNIRLALRKAVSCKLSSVSHFGEFWKLMQETAKRDKFRTHPREYYKKILNIIGTMSVRLHIAYHDTKPIAAAIVGYFGDAATYLHGASSYEHRALMGPYALHWSIMQDAKNEGYKVYDFWGTTARQHAEGIARFKIGFASEASPDRSVGSGHIINYPGTFDLLLNKFWYTIYKIGRRLF